MIIIQLLGNSDRYFFDIMMGSFTSNNFEKIGCIYNFIGKQWSFIIDMLLMVGIY